MGFIGHEAVDLRPEHAVVVAFTGVIDLPPVAPGHQQIRRIAPIKHEFDGAAVAGSEIALLGGSCGETIRLPFDGRKGIHQLYAADAAAA